MTNESSPAYLKLKSADATKLGRNGGSVSYLILSDVDRQHLYFSMVGNSGGGCWSTECVPLSAVEACLPADRNQPLAAKALMPAFVGRSVNNPTFLAAVLRAERLLVAADEKPSQHQAVPDWSAWMVSMLSAPGDPYVPATKAAPVGALQATSASHAMTRQESPESGEADDDLQPKGRKRRPGKVAGEVENAPAP